MKQQDSKEILEHTYWQGVFNECPNNQLLADIVMEAIQSLKSELAGTLIDLQEQKTYLANAREQIVQLTKLTGNFPNGMGDYEWKIVENYNSKNHVIAQLEKEKEAKDEEITTWIEKIEKLSMEVWEDSDAQLSAIVAYLQLLKDAE